MRDNGKSAIPGDRIVITPYPLGQKDLNGSCYSGGPVFDLTPKDPVNSNLCIDTLPSPYGPPYGKQSGG